MRHPATLESMKQAVSRAPRNRTLILEDKDHVCLRPRLLEFESTVGLEVCLDRTILGDSLSVLPLLPRKTVDLLIVDPPYNLTKSFNETEFKRRSPLEYEEWLRSWIRLVLPTLRPTASAYICSEWRSSGAVQRVLEEHFQIQNRITWEREKGRGATRNWKNCSEDIWFCTVCDDYWFDVDAVKQKRKVVAPYRDENRKPKDWEQEDGDGFRFTHPSNLWNDISVPFWSMPENTDHPTQKPEKLVAKLILASSKRGDVVLDPFLGSGTTSVVAKKLGRRFIGIEVEEEYCLLAERRLQLADLDASIQGYSEGVFWERNTLALQQKKRTSAQLPVTVQNALFER
jgi:site-specific DNA-methyltransferase (adenine-specific)